MAEKKSEVRKCFVVCPIGAEGSPTRTHADWLLDEIVQPVFDREYEGKFSIVRSDRIDTPGMIDAQIINHLIDDDLVIADMTDLNANAFYELGIRHMAQKPVVHMFKMGQDIPFDVKLFRAVAFDYCDAAALRNARAGLARALADVLADNHAVDNPVIRARGQQKIELSSMPEIKMLQRQMSEMQERIVRLDPTNNASHLMPKASNKHLNYENLKFSAANGKKIIVRFSHDLTDVELMQYEKTINALASKHELISVDLTGFGDVVIVSALGDYNKLVSLVKTIGLLPNVTEAVLQ